MVKINGDNINLLPLIDGQCNSIVIYSHRTNALNINQSDLLSPAMCICCW